MTKKKIDRVVAIDLGNGLTNIRTVYPDGSPYELTLPSAFAKTESIGISFDGAGEKYNVSQFVVDGGNYVWGEDVYKIKGLIHTASSHEERYEMSNYRTFIEIVLGKIAKDVDIQPTEQILISTGVPSNQTKPSTVEAIKNAFFGTSKEYKGLHRITVDGQVYTINVAEVIVTSQPLATVLAHYLNEKGKVINKSLASKRIAIIDIGGGTTDLDTLVRFNRQENFRSIPVGFRQVYRAIRDEIRRQNDGKEVDVNDYELLNIIQNAEAKANEEGTEPVYTYKISDKKAPIDFTDTYLRALKELGMIINMHISEQWAEDFDNFDYVYLVGGSAKRLAPFIEILKNPDFPRDPGKSNAEGYYNFGVAKMNELNAA